MDAVLLARMQFALTIGFHFLFPPISIGLAWMLVVIEGLGWRTADPRWIQGGRFFGKLLALTFAVGVATGIVMEFQFGTNWASYSRFVGDIFGAPLAAEGVFAFFLESGFLGLYLFGRGRVSPRLHWISILMVALGATLSAFWIIVANSWQQTPAGFWLNPATGRAELVDFMAAVFNPSTLPRYFHTMTAALSTGAFFVAGISGWLVTRGRSVEVSARTLKVGLVAAMIFSVLSAFPTGHEHARQVARTQPEKFAAIEGLYETQTSAPLVFFALPKNDPPELKATLEFPALLSWMAFGDFDAKVMGIQEFPADEIPPLWITFVSFHNMVLIGLAMQGLAALGLFLWWRGSLLRQKRYLQLLFWASPLPLLACQFGWAAAETGRQPWAVYKLLRTSDAVSVTVTAPMILASILMFGVVAMLLLSLYLFLLRREIQHGPAEVA